jgi:hypothetical protein
VLWWPGSFSLILVTKPFFGEAAVVSSSTGVFGSTVSADLWWWPGSLSIILFMKLSFLGAGVGESKAGSDEARAGSDAGSQETIISSHQ